jgi:hypothetical protein
MNQWKILTTRELVMHSWLMFSNPWIQSSIPTSGHWRVKFDENNHLTHQLIALVINCKKLMSQKYLIPNITPKLSWILKNILIGDIKILDFIHFYFERNKNNWKFELKILKTNAYKNSIFGKIFTVFVCKKVDLYLSK